MGKLTIRLAAKPCLEFRALRGQHDAKLRRIDGRGFFERLDNFKTQKGQHIVIANASRAAKTRLYSACRSGSKLLSATRRSCGPHGRMT